MRKPTLTPYRNLSENSGVIAYRISADKIVIEFRNGDQYEYTVASCGAAAVQVMQQYARTGRGLSTFISQHNPKYARKLS